MRFFDGIEEDLKSHERKFSHNLNFLNEQTKVNENLLQKKIWDKQEVVFEKPS